MKIEDLNPDELVVSVKMYYKGEQWEMYKYVYTSSLMIDEIIADCQEKIDTLAYPIAKCLGREDVAKKLMESNN